MTAPANHYLTLGVSPRASVEEIRARFRQLALVHHPDQNGGSADSQAQFLLIHNAWRVLGDPAAKAEYDRYLVARAAPSRSVGKPQKPPVPPRTTAEEVRNSLNSLLWDIEDLIRIGGPLSFQKDLLRILTFLDQWVLEPAGFVDYFMEARGLERLNPSSYIDFICQSPHRLTHFPFTSVSNYYYDIRKRMNRYLDQVGGLPWLEPLPGKTVRFIDALLEAQNLAVHYLSGLRRFLAGEITEVPRFVPSHPDFR